MKRSRITYFMKLALIVMIAFSMTFTFAFADDDLFSPDLSDYDYELESDNFDWTYTGKPIRPEIYVQNGGYYLGPDRIKVTYKNNVNVGTATIVVTGIGDVSGTFSTTFKIVPTGTRITKVAGLKRGIKVVWKRNSTKMKTSRITGYQVQISTDKSFAKNKKTYTVKGYKKTVKKIYKLKSKKVYYVRVRTYKKVGSKNYYSDWSTRKAVKAR